MTEHRDIQSALDHLEAALAASCATLMALESEIDGTEHGTPAAQGDIRQAIASLREAISELRALNDVDTSMLAFGFVLVPIHDGPASANGPMRRPTQLRPQNRDPRPGPAPLRPAQPGVQPGDGQQPDPGLSAQQGDVHPLERLVGVATYSVRARRVP